MITIPIAVCGDDWVNRDSVVEQLQHIDPREPVILNLCSEAPSLGALGILEAVLDALPETTIYIVGWANTVEPVPFRKLDYTIISQFFWLSDNYRSAVPTHRTAEYQFGYFVGRRTIPRCVILKDIHEKYRDSFLLSLMNTVAGFKSTELDPLERWCNTNEFYNWYNNQTIPSLDGHTVRDQYFGNHNTNASLLRWYHQFDIELVAETYCHGETFFATEKTVRPMVAGKSMLVYGPQNYLARLRDLGFQTWHTVWDEGYDQLTSIDRWHAIQLIIKDLISRDQQQLYQQCFDIVKHNQQHVQTLINKYRPG